MVTFTHLDPSTPESAWTEAGLHSLPELPCGVLEGASRVVVLAAHPDDELLGCVNLLLRVRELGPRGPQLVTLLFTAGENSHPGSPSHSPERLADVRLREFEALARDLFPQADCRVERFTDGRLTGSRSELRALIESAAGFSAAEFPDAGGRDESDDDAAAAPGRGLVLVAPRHDDGHTDHETLGQLALEVGRERGALVLEYPIWYWHWAKPANPAWRGWVRLTAPEQGSLTLERLWAHYPSQTSPLSPAEGDEPILGADFLEHFRRGFDTFSVTDFRAGPDSPAETDTQPLTGGHSEERR